MQRTSHPDTSAFSIHTTAGEIGHHKGKMINPSLHPEPVHTACHRAAASASLSHRAPSACWPRDFCSRCPASFRRGSATACCCGTRSSSSPRFYDGRRLPAPRLITAERTWSNAPALDSNTEIEIALTQQSDIALDLRLIDDLPNAFVATPATHKLQALPRVRAALRYTIEPRERGDARAGSVFVRYTSPLRLVERWAVAPLEQTVRIYPALRQGEEQQIFLARSRQIDLQLRQQRQRGLGREFESLREYRRG